MSGFQVYNEVGALQLDSNYIPYVLVAKGTISVQGLNSYDTDNAVGVTVNPRTLVYEGQSVGSTRGYKVWNGSAYSYRYYRSPKLVLASTEAFVAVVGCIKIDRSVTWYLSCGNFAGSSSAGLQSKTIPYYIFDAVPNNILTETHNGLNLYDTRGDVLYSSDYPPLKMVNRGVGPTGTLSPSATNTVVTAPAGNYGAMIYDGRISTIYRGGSNNIRMFEGVRITSTGAETNRVYSYLVSTTAGGHRTSPGCSVFLVDLAGL